MRSLIQRFGRDITVTRNDSEVIFIDGYAQVNSCERTLKVRASVQPATSEDLEALPEGSDSKESKKFYTIEKLKIREGNPPTKGDIVFVNGKYYEIFSCEDHFEHNAMNIFYYKSIGIRVSYDV